MRLQKIQLVNRDERSFSITIAHDNDALSVVQLHNIPAQIRAPLDAFVAQVGDMFGCGFSGYTLEMKPHKDFFRVFKPILETDFMGHMAKVSIDAIDLRKADDIAGDIEALIQSENSSDGPNTYKHRITRLQSQLDVLRHWLLLDECVQENWAVISLPAEAKIKQMNLFPS